jgi:hypothetical protein
MSETNIEYALALPRDTRPQRGAWAPGLYGCRCGKCGEDFTGDKGSAMCAVCAYAGPEAQSPRINENTIASISDDDLLKRAVKNARSREYRKGWKHPRWVAVSNVFCLGPTFSVQLCKRFGLDPDEQVKR